MKLRVIGKANPDRVLIAILFSAMAVSATLVGRELYMRVRQSRPISNLPRWKTLVDDANLPATVQFAVAEQPLIIRLNPVANVFDQKHLYDALPLLQPYFNPDGFAGRMPMSAAIHSLRLWGTEARFKVGTTDDRIVPASDSAFLISGLFNHSQFLRTYSVGVPALLVKSPFGIHALSMQDGIQNGHELQAHVGQLVAMASEIGMKSSYRVLGSDGVKGNIADIVRDTAARVEPAGELEWITIGLSRYAEKNTKSWTNRFHQECSFDALVNELCSRPIGFGACGGTHVPYALAVLLRADEEKDLLTVPARRKAILYFHRLCAGLEDAQTTEGAWNFSWCEAYPDGIRLIVPPEYKNQITQEFVVTGHHLEWMTLVRSELRPKEATIRRAANYLLERWSRFIKEEVSANWHIYNPSSHAARALWLVSGVPETDQDYGRMTEYIRADK